jgi:hypothetical protein
MLRAIQSESRTGGRRATAAFLGMLASLMLGATAKVIDAADAENPPAAPHPSPAITLGHSSTVEPRRRTTTHQLSIAWFDPTNAVGDMGEAIGAELRSLFRRLSTDIEWRRVEAGEVIPAEADIPVILLREDPSRERRDRRIMGLVPKTNDAPSIWVFVGPVRRTLGLPSQSSARDAAEGLARAVGRVVAHEILHVIAPEVPHARLGLMHHSLNRAVLLSPAISLDDSCAQAFLARVAVRNSAVAPPLGAL